MLDELRESFYFNWYAFPVLIVAVLIPVTGFYIYYQNKKSATNRSFFLLCLAILCWLFGQVGVYSSKDPELAIRIYRTVAFLGVTLISPMVYFFSTVWLGLYAQKKNLVRLGFLGAAFFYILGLFSERSFPGVRTYFWGYFPIYGVYNMIFLVFFFSYFFAAFYNFFAALRRENDKTRLLQIRYILIAFLVSFLSSLDYVPKVMSFSLYPLGFLYVFFWISMVAYAIIRYKAMDIETVIHKTIMWFCSAVIAVSPFAVFVYSSQGWMRNREEKFATFFYVILLFAFYSYFRAIKPHLDLFFQRRKANLQAVSSQFSAELVHLKDLRNLLQSTARMLRRNLFVSHISIFLKSSFGEELAPAIVKKLRGLKPFALSNPFLKWLEENDEIAIAEFMGGNPSLTAIKSEMSDYLSKVEAAVVVPFILGGKLIGVLNLGRKKNLRKYTSEEIIFLSEIKSALTIAFSNSLQFIAMQENLSKWNEELEKKVVERTKELQDTQAQLVQAEKLATIGTLAGGIAHEINNPLTAVLTNAQLLKMGANSEDLESVDLIEQGAKRCQIIIQKLMKYSRKPIEAELFGKVDINKVIDNTVAFLSYQIEQENVELAVEKRTNSSIIEGNANELEQVFTNLILNAKDAIKQTSKPGEIKITITKDKNSVMVTVTDNGIGIPKMNISKIFDPFFTTKEIGKGTGLGLAVSYGIVQKHKGKMNVLSEPSIKTQFNIEFPLVADYR